MITLREALPEEAALRQALEASAPAETAMLWAEAPLLGFGNAGLWQQTDPTGRATALLLRNPTGGVTLAPLPQADPGELAEFLQVVGWSSVTLPGSFGLPLPGRSETCLLMEWEPRPFALPGELRAEPVSAAALLRNTLAAFGEPTDPEVQQEWQWAFALRTRRQTALALGLFCAETQTAAAALSHIGPTAAVVGFVGTPPPFRGKGYGSLAACAAASHAAQLGLRPLLCCQPRLEEFYRRAGFRTVGCQTVMQSRSKTGLRPQK